MTRFEYHEKDDIAVFEYGNYSDYQRSIDVANFVIDLSENGEFLGLDVIGASERLPLNRKQLSKVEDVEITVQEEEGNVMVTVVMKLGNEKTSLNLPVTGGMTGQVTQKPFLRVISVNWLRFELKV